MTLSAALSNQPTVRTGCFQFTQKSYFIYTDKHTFSVPKRQLPLQADLIINRLQKEIKERTGAHLDQRDELIQQRLWLKNELDNVGAG